MSILVQNYPLDPTYHLKSSTYPNAWIRKYQKFVPPKELDTSEKAKIINLRPPDDVIQLPENYTSELCLDGISGTYFLMQKGKRFAVFKPSDEEPGCLNNPKQESSRVLDGVKPGDGAIREYLAYLLDRDHFAKVPKTMISDVFIRGKGVKNGSLQEYIENEGSMDDFGSGLFSVENVQRIAQFDVRTLNMDRHSGNFLVIDGEKKELIPIDHSYIVPEVLNGARFDWENWKQASQPILPVVASYIMNIDVEADVLILEKMNVSKKAVENFKIASLFLKKACSMNWNFKRMAQFVCKNDGEKTGLEMIVEKVKLASVDQQTFWNLYNETLDLEILQ